MASHIQATNGSYVENVFFEVCDDVQREVVNEMKPR